MVIIKSFATFDNRAWERFNIKYSYL